MGFERAFFSDASAGSRARPQHRVDKLLCSEEGFARRVG